MQRASRALRSPPSQALRRAPARAARQPDELSRDASLLVLLRCPQPSRSVRESELGERLRTDLDAVAGRRRHLVAAADDADRVDEVLVQVVDELAYPVVERAAEGDVVEDRDVLGVLAEPDSARVRADRHAELRREQ